MVARGRIPRLSKCWVWSGGENAATRPRTGSTRSKNWPNSGCCPRFTSYSRGRGVTPLCIGWSNREFGSPVRKSAKPFARWPRKKTDHLEDSDLAVLGYERWIAGLEAGVASHHAGLVPAFKETVEELFEIGYLKAVFATETLALGINMPGSIRGYRESLQVQRRQPRVASPR